MSYYEITLTAFKTVCVKARNEQDAINKAIYELPSTFKPLCRVEINVTEEIKKYEQSGKYYEFIEKIQEA